jgi:hypothetical protein
MKNDHYGQNIGHSRNGKIPEFKGTLQERPLPLSQIKRSPVGGQ